ncbi:MAG: hypothetical protein QCI00_07535 [Candidatus Thermoplasmatota archaeon]|nr:hypothetical protein [Candidatus Thermoplasmatota archaeon]
MILILLVASLLVNGCVEESANSNKGKETDIPENSNNNDSAGDED